MPLGGPQQYLCKYNSYTLPGYVQEESFESQMSIAAHPSTYADGSQSEYTGLQNKNLNIRVKVWESDFSTAKEQIQLGATYLRTLRQGFGPLYVQYSDRHYDALVGPIRVENTAGKSPRIMEYQVQFECKPWLINDAITTISGVGTIDTDQVGRTIDNGGWTPTTITVDGTNVTISGYKTSTGDFAGFISISGAVSGMVIDAENYTAEISGLNRNDLMMRYADYQMMVAPGKTTYVITGATACSVSYHDRWYI